MVPKSKQLLKQLDSAIDSITPKNFEEKFNIIIKVIDACKTDKSGELLEGIKDSFGDDDEFNKLVDKYLKSPNGEGLSDIKSMLLRSTGLVNNSDLVEDIINSESDETLPEESSQSNLEESDEIEITEIDISNSSLVGEIQSLMEYANEYIDKVINEQFHRTIGTPLDYLEVPKQSELHSSILGEIENITPIESGKYKFYKLYPFDSDEFILVIKDDTDPNSIKLELVSLLGIINKYIDPSVTSVNLSDSEGKGPIGTLKKLISELKSTSYEDVIKAIDTITAEYGEMLGEGLREVVNISSLSNESLNFSDNSSDINNTEMKDKSNLTEDTPTLDSVVHKLEEMTPEKASDALAEIDAQHGEKIAEDLQSLMISDEEKKDEIVNESELKEEAKLQEIDKTIDECEECAENFSISKTKKYNKYLQNFSKAGLIKKFKEPSQDDIRKLNDQIAEESVKRTVTPGEVVSKLINMSDENKAEILAEVEEEVGEDVAETLSEAVKEKKIPEMSESDLNDVAEIIESNECDTKNFSSKSNSSYKLYKKYLKNFSEQELTQDTLVSEMEEMTPSQSAEALAKIASKTTPLVSDKLQAEILKEDSEEFSSVAEELPELTEDEVKLAEEVIKEAKEGQVNCSNSKSAYERRLYNKYMSNFSEVLVEVDSNDHDSESEEEDDAELVHESESEDIEVIESMLDSTPEEVVAVTTKIADEGDPELANKVETALIEGTESLDEFSEDEIKTIEEAKDCCEQANFSSSSSNFKTRLANFSKKINRLRKSKLNNFSEMPVSETVKLIDKLSDSTPEEVATVSTVLENKCGKTAADELEHAIIENVSGHPITSDEEVELTEEEVKLASSIDPKEVNCSKGKLSSIYTRRLANFSEEIQKAHDEIRHSESDDDEESEESEIEDVESTESAEATPEVEPESEELPETESEVELTEEDKEKILDNLSDSTPEELATVSTEVECRLGEEAADELEDAVIAHCKEINELPIELEEEVLETASKIDPKEVNCSSVKKRRIYNKRLTNFSKKIKLANFSSISAGKYIKKAALGSTNIPSAGKSELAEVVGTAPYRLNSEFFGTKLAKSQGLCESLASKILSGKLIWRNKLDPKSPEPIDLQIVEIVDLGNGVASVRMYDVNSAKVEKTLWSKSEDELNKFVESLQSTELKSTGTDELRNYSEESESVEPNTKEVSEESSTSKINETPNAAGIKRAIVPGIPVEIQVKPEDVESEEPEEDHDEKIMSEIQENFSKSENIPKQQYAKMFGRVMGTNY